MLGMGMGWTTDAGVAICVFPGAGGCLDWPQSDTTMYDGSCGR